jgi:hypothetical protein
LSVCPFSFGSLTLNTTTIHPIKPHRHDSVYTTQR